MPSASTSAQAAPTIAKLQARPELQALWDAARTSEGALAECAATLCAIPAATFQEQDRGDWVARFLSERCGLELHSDALGNRWAIVRGAQGPGPRILVTAHLDTVFPAGVCCEVRRERGRLLGPGIGDNAAGLSVLLAGTRLLCAAGRPFAGEIIVAATVGEEGLGDLRGIRALCQKFHGRLDAVLALDGRLGQTVGAAVGSRRYRIHVQGPGGHPWSDSDCPSAIHHLARLAAALADVKLPAQPRTILNVGTISGGTSVNTVAAEAELCLDLRSANYAALAELDARVCLALESVPHPQLLNVRVECVGDRPVGEAGLTEEWVAIAKAAWAALSVPHQVTVSSTEANVPLSLGLRATALGVCRGGGAHTLGEWIDPASLPVGLEGFLLTLLAALEIFEPSAFARSEATDEG